MNLPQAAVAIVHARGPEESILLIRRTERESDPWSGHWAFPGGRRDPGDADLIATALRELHEECGIVVGRDALEAELPVTTAGRMVGRHMIVAPFVFAVPDTLPTVVDPDEAAEAVWVPVKLLKDPTQHVIRPVPWMPEDRHFDTLDLNGVPLWGFTYKLLTEWLGVQRG